MKYIPKRGIFFLHIPKCAGKSVHAALDAEVASYEAFASDLGVEEDQAELLATSKAPVGDAAGGFVAGFDLPKIGRVHPAHLPLFAIRKACPQTWAALTGAKFSFAMTRDPRERFLSALLQRMKEFGDAGAIRADDSTVRIEAEKVCAWLGERDRFADLEYVHFIRQSDFIEDNGQRILTDIFPVNRTDFLAERLRARTGLDASIARSHTRRQPKRWARGVQPVARFAARRLMPRQIKKMVYPLWTGSALFADAAATYDKVSLGQDTEMFLKKYYARDTELFEEALAAAAPALEAAT